MSTKRRQCFSDGKRRRFVNLAVFGYARDELLGARPAFEGDAMTATTIVARTVRFLASLTVQIANGARHPCRCRVPSPTKVTGNP